MSGIVDVYDLKRLRRKWRRESTRLRSSAKTEEHGSGTRDRCIYEANIYEMCANDIDRVINRDSA